MLKSLFRSKTFLAVLMAVLMASATLPAVAQSRLASVDQGIQSLMAEAGPETSLRLDEATGVVRFARFAPGAVRNLKGAAPADQAADLLMRHGKAFGIEDFATELRLESVRTGSTFTSVTYDQIYQGIPVFAGRLRAHFDSRGDLVAIHGAFIPEISLLPKAFVKASAAERLAIDHVASQTGAADLGVGEQGLTIFRTGLVRGVPGSTHLAFQIEVLNENRTVRELVFVDAHTGLILDQITGIHTILSRQISETSLANVVWVEGNPDPIPAGWAGGSASQVTAWQDEAHGARETYNVFASMTNNSYQSYDGASAIMRTVNNDPGIACPNANWNGISTNYCNGVTGDDTVAHEWGHAYTEYTNNLIYQWQSGALNESYSDIWGEVVDLVNGRGLDVPNTLRDSQGRYCSSLGSGPKRRDTSYRWLSGEDDPAFNGAIRDLWRPNCYGDPGKVTDSEYHCATSDSGGVHTNSGVPNHGFALMVDGGTFNGQTITGIGLTKAARLHWEAQNLLTPSSNFVDHADALQTACTALIGATLYELNAQSPNGVVSAQTFTAANCTQVANAIAAVQFRTPPTQCNFQPLLNPNAPALCGGGAVTTLNLQDWEAGLGLWSVGTRAVVNPGTFSTPDWAVVSGLPNRSGSAAFVEDNPAYGDCSTDIEAGVLFLDSPSISLTAGASSYGVAFDHWMASEVGWDGGNVKISVNSGAYNLVPGSAFGFNAYNANLNTVAQGSDNPLAGQASFTGTDGGSSSGSWGQSQIGLAGIAGGGDNVRLRFEMGLDGCNGVVGWYVDAVRTYSCAGGGGGCDNDGTCEPGENCNNCSNDCKSKINGPPSGRYCCGDGIVQAAETSALCNGNF